MLTRVPIVLRAIHLICATDRQSAPVRSRPCNSVQHQCQTLPPRARRCKSWQIDARTSGSRDAALRSMKGPGRDGGRRQPRVLFPVYHDSSCGYIPYPVPKLSRFSVDDAVDSSGGFRGPTREAPSGRLDNDRRRHKEQTRHMAGFVALLRSLIHAYLLNFRFSSLPDLVSRRICIPLHV